MTKKAMEKMYVEFGCDERTFNMFREMRSHNLIDADTWDGFYEKCKSYVVEGDEIYDTKNNKIIYMYDSKGNLHKVG